MVYFVIFKKHAHVYIVIDYIKDIILIENKEVCFGIATIELSKHALKIDINHSKKTCHLRSTDLRM